MNEMAVERMKRGAMIGRMAKEQAETLKRTRAMLIGGPDDSLIDRGSVLDNLEWALTLSRRISDVSREISETAGEGG